jgi:hypothetical protein
MALVEGTTTSIAIAPFGSSRQHNAMKDWMKTYWLSVKLSMRRLVLDIHVDGAVAPEIGKEPRQSI